MTQNLDKNKMLPQSEVQERFLKTYSKVVNALLEMKSTIQGKGISIVICPTIKENYISNSSKNQLLIPESSVIEKRYTYGDKQYEIIDLQLTIDEYKFTSQLNVVTIYLNEVDIILGSPWMETQGTFILNTKKKFLTFSYKKKNTILQDSTWKSDPVT